MKQFAKNVLRATANNKLPFIGATLVIALAVTIFIGLMDFSTNLLRNVEPYFDQSAFADIFAEVDGIYEGDLEDLAEIEGVAQVFGRQSINASLDTEENQLITLHLLAYSSDDTLNKISIINSAEELDKNAIYLSESMESYMNYSIGDTLKLNLSGTSVEFVYSGTANTPQYLYFLPDSSIQAPLNDLYAIAVVDKSRLEEITGRKSIVNEIGIKLEPGYNAKDFLELVKGRLEEKGAVYDVCIKSEQDCYQTIMDEIETYESVSYIIPLLFLIGATFMVYIILKKTIDNDRTVIGTMKAMGARNNEILSVYLKQCFIMGTLASVIAIIGAYPIGSYLLDDSISYYSIPNAVFYFNIWPRVVGILFAFGISILSTWLGVKEIININPSESMRPSEPKTGRNINLPEFLKKQLNSRQNIALRAIFRNPFRSFAIAFAIAFPISLICSGVVYAKYTLDSSNKRIEVVEASDVKLVLKENTLSEDLEQSLRQMEYVEDSQAAYAQLIDLKFGNHSYICQLTAYNPEGSFFNPIDNRNNIIKLPDDGLAIDNLVAEKLGVEEGDIIEINDPLLSDNTVRIPVTAIFYTYSGYNAYINLESFCNYFDTSSVSNIAYCNVEEGYQENFIREIKKASNINYIVESDRLMEEYIEMNAATVVIAYLVVIFAVISGAIMIYSIVSMNIRERKNEFGTMLVLGMRRRETLEIILLEQIFNLLIGLLLSLGFIPLMKKVFDIALTGAGYWCDMDITPKYMLIAMVICVIITIISVIRAYMEIDKLNLPDVLKERS